GLLLGAGRPAGRAQGGAGDGLLRLVEADEWDLGGPLEEGFEVPLALDVRGELVVHDRGPELGGGRARGEQEGEDQADAFAAGAHREGEGGADGADGARGAERGEGVAVVELVADGDALAGGQRGVGDGDAGEDLVDRG